VVEEGFVASLASSLISCTCLATCSTGSVW
jgi:hypothetical protein